ncbi:MAG: hypothetical protein A3G24_24530 [Betaproteobacteria bacterium RIFCSPLOWO2_12_FULL_62_13]|nr:MAG: hypothetical protein A3G24_24530 [Betaproteobacteria bacterium RIFCSPLOWO2_12_FULL_62_13]
MPMNAAKDITCLRFAFTGEITGRETVRKLDDGIIRAVWLTPEEIRRTRARHRSPPVVRRVEDYPAGRRYPLSLLVDHSG